MLFLYLNIEFIYHYTLFEITLFSKISSKVYTFYEISVISKKVQYIVDKLSINIICISFLTVCFVLRSAKLTSVQWRPLMAAGTRSSWKRLWPGAPLSPSRSTLSWTAYSGMDRMVTKKESQSITPYWGGHCSYLRSHLCLSISTSPSEGLFWENEVVRHRPLTFIKYYFQTYTWTNSK